MPQLPTSGEYKLSPTSISFEDLSKYLQTLINVDSSRMPPGTGPILTEGSFEQNISISKTKYLSSPLSSYHSFCFYLLCKLAVIRDKWPDLNFWVFLTLYLSPQARACRPRSSWPTCPRCWASPSPTMTSPRRASISPSCPCQLHHPR